MREIQGIPVSPGVVIGRVFLLSDTRRPVHARAAGAGQSDAELERFDRAIATSLEELESLRESAAAQLGPDAASIFAFHQGMLRDPSLINPIKERITQEGLTAEYAAQEQFRKVADMFQSMPESTFRTKVDDVWDLDHRVLRHLVGEQVSELKNAPEGTIVVGAELTPSQTTAFDPERIVGFATELGGSTSHVAIFARALRLPAVLGVESLLDLVQDGDQMVIDGGSGVVVIDPDQDTLDRYAGVAERAHELRERLGSLRELPAQTRDGERIQLLGNIEFAREVKGVKEEGGDGVGLFRTEYLWLTAEQEPSEDEQYEEFRRAIELADGAPVTIRTIDLGADKHTQEQALYPERNPFLGMRSLRYCLKHPEMFKRHLRAILRASALGKVKIMFPLVSTFAELRQARLILRDVMEDLDEMGVAFDRRVPVGMMVEVPSAAVMASAFAREVDFFSIGTNDLVQYTLAVDRGNERVASLYDAGHPAVIRLIKEVVRSARKRGIEVSLCGEMAGDPIYTMLLLGLGLRMLSLSSPRLPYIKEVVRGVTIEDCERLARKVGSFDSGRQVSDYLCEHARRIFPELFDGRTGDMPA